MLLLGISFSLPVKAQEQSDTIVRASRIERVREKRILVRSKVDRILDKRQRITTDTLYISRPEQPLTIRVKTDIYSNSMRFHSRHDDNTTATYEIKSALKETIGFSANYRGISLSLSLNPKQILGKNSDIEYQLNFYRNSFGADITYSYLHSFKGKDNIGIYNGWYDLPNTLHEGLSINGYWVFNRRRFSYPAVFSHSWIQRRSAGSFLVGASGYIGALDLGDFYDDIPQMHGRELNRITMSHISVGAGYGYNLVTPNRKMLIHLSAMPTLIVWKNYKLHYNDGNDNMTTDPLGMFMVARGGFTYSWKKYFAGANGVLNFSLIGLGTDVSHFNEKLNIRFYIGIRI